MNFNIQNYQGRWYEIAKYYFPLEQGCTSATADYILQNNNNNIVVVNTCYRNNQPIKQNIGLAQPTTTSGKLLLSFNYEINFNNATGYPIQSPQSNYNVLWTDYRNFSFVGTNSKQFFWILSRKPQITNQEWAFIVRKSRELGYEPRKLIVNNNQSSY